MEANIIMIWQNELNRKIMQILVIKIVYVASSTVLRARYMFLEVEIQLNAR